MGDPDSPTEVDECEPTDVFTLIQKSFTKTNEAAQGITTIGPMLRFTNYDTGCHLWKGTVLFVAPSSLGKPALTYSVDGGPPCDAPCEWLDTFQEHNFYRYALQVEASDAEQAVMYSLQWDGDSTPVYTFYVAARDQAWHWSFFSCNGYQAECTDLKLYEDITILWNDMLAQHNERHMHAMVGGGDQIYNDPVWQVPEIGEWLQIKDGRQRALTDLPGVGDSSARYYFNHYATHFSTDGFKQAMATIPYLMTWDDHDIFDGWGSYPPYLHNCAVFQKIFKSALRFYLLFQNHATPDNTEAVEVFGAPHSYSWMVNFGPKMVLLGPDSRTQRTSGRIIGHEHWEEISQRLDQIDADVQHLVIVFAVPFVYGEIPASEKVMDFFKCDRRGRIRDWLTIKTGLLSGLLGQFGEPNLMDDIGDHWTSKNHEPERNMVLKKLQEVAAVKKIRVSFMSGDVHVAGICRITSNPDSEEVLAEADYMLQVISSAIGNSPPPKVLGKVLNAPMTSGRKKIDDRLWMHFLQLFKQQYPQNKKILLKRNWCDVTVDDGSTLTFALRVEDSPGDKGTAIHTFSTALPALKA